MMDIGTVAIIVTGILTVLGTFFGFKYNKVKKALKESVDVGLAVVIAYQDDKVSAEETDKIIAEAKEAYAAWKDVFIKST